VIVIRSSSCSRGARKCDMPNGNSLVRTNGEGETALLILVFRMEE